MRMKGSWVAIITPYDKKGGVNFSRFKELIHFHVRYNTSGLLVMGSTGESSLLSLEERRKIIEEVSSFAEGKIPVFMGCTSSTTKETVELAKFAQMQEGTSGILLVVPPYVTPPQQAIYDFFKTVADNVDLPIAIYNNPSRVGVNISAETIIKLADIDNIIADKEAIPNVAQLAKIKREAADKIDILCCDYPGYGLILPTLSLGGTGTANVAGNVIPEEMELLSKPWESWDDVLQARKLYHKVTPLIELLYSTSNPVPVKAAMNLLGMDVGSARRPLSQMDEDRVKKLRKVMDSLGFVDKYSF